MHVYFRTAWSRTQSAGSGGPGLSPAGPPPPSHHRATDPGSRPGATLQTWATGLQTRGYTTDPGYRPGAPDPGLQATDQGYTPGAPDYRPGAPDPGYRATDPG